MLCGEGWGIRKGSATLKNFVVSSHKVCPTNLARDPAGSPPPHYLPQEKRKRVHKETCRHIFSTLTHNRQKLEPVSTGRRRKRQIKVYPYNGVISINQKHELLIHTTHVGVKNITLSERSQIQRYTTV
jgi:hypothetical protein